MSEVVIVWSDKAKNTYHGIIEFLSVKWTQNEIHTFISRTETVIGKIAQNPYLFQQYKTDPLVRRAVLHDTVILIYKVAEEGQVIILLTFWPTRKNPRNIKL